MTIKKRTEIDLIADIGFIIYLVTEFAFSHSFLGQLGLIVFFLTTCLLIISNNMKVNNSYYFFFSALFIFYNWINIEFGYAINPSASIELLKTLCLNLLIFFCLYNYVLLRKDMERIIILYLLSCFLVTVGIFLFSLPTIFSIRLGTTLDINPNVIAIGASIAFLISLYFLVVEKKKYNYLFLFWFLSIVLLTGSRKGILIIGIGSLILNYLLFPRKRYKSLIISTFTIVFLYILVLRVPTLYELIGVRLEALIDFIRGYDIEEDSLRTRNNLITTGWELFLFEPLRGYGLNAFRYSGLFNTYSHNNFIEILVSSGIVGFFIYYINHIITFFKAFLINKKEIIIVKLLLTINIVMLIMDLAMVTYYERFFLNTFILLIAFIKLSERASVKSLES